MTLNYTELMKSMTAAGLAPESEEDEVRRICAALMDAISMPHIHPVDQPYIADWSGNTLVVDGKIDFEFLARAVVKALNAPPSLQTPSKT